jgi:hypothetical protein
MARASAVHTTVVNSGDLRILFCTDLLVLLVVGGVAGVDIVLGDRTVRCMWLSR